MILFSERLFTHRLVLRKIHESDIPLMVAWSQSKKACGEYLTPGKHDAEQMRQQIQSSVYWTDREKRFVVELKEDGHSVGTAHYWHSSGKGNTVTMSLLVAIPEERGKGYGTEIQKSLIIYIFDHLPVEAVEMYTDINNIAQQRCLQKLGFELVESLIYDDQQEKRTGHLFRLTAERYRSHLIYQFDYE